LGKRNYEKQIANHTSSKEKICQLNACLKAVGKLAQFNEVVEVIRFPKGVKKVEHKKLFEMLTTHAATRIFITLSLSKRMLASY
jgi:hypothetical protein